MPPDLTLTAPLWCLPDEPGGEDRLLPAGSLIRDLWRGEDHGELGHGWRFAASFDGGATWQHYETQWDDSEGPFPVALVDGVE